MEFSISIASEVLGNDRYGDPEAEHRAIRQDVECILAAERYGFKYAFVAEHHCLTQYSHMSASEAFIPYVLALTDRIHVGSGIWPLNPATNHPVRLAERAAMCDHLSNGRFEFGTGRGAGSWEVGTFNVDPDDTKANWAEVITEFKKMWESDDPRMGTGPAYSHAGRAFSTPPRNIIPKPLGGAKTHPPMWCAVANIPTFQKCAEHGIGSLAFGLLGTARKDYAPFVDAYKSAISDAEPVGQFVNDNFLISCMTICLDDPDEARAALTRSSTSYFRNLVFFYHDTFPRPEWAQVWPERSPEPSIAEIETMIDRGSIMCGSPDEVIAQVSEYEAAGIDTLNLPVAGKPHDVVMETIKTFGEKVIPHFDRDPIHRTARMRYGDRAAEMVAARGADGSHFDSSVVARTVP